MNCGDSTLVAAKILLVLRAIGNFFINKRVIFTNSYSPLNPLIPFSMPHATLNSQVAASSVENIDMNHTSSIQHIQQTSVCSHSRSLDCGIPELEVLEQEPDNPMIGLKIEYAWIIQFFLTIILYWINMINYNLLYKLIL